MSEPPAGHSSRLIELSDDEDELLPTDPSAIIAQPAEHAQLFEEEIEFFEQRTLARRRGKDGAHGEFERVERAVVEPLAKGEARAFRKIGSAIQRPADDLGEHGVNWRFVRRGHPCILRATMNRRQLSQRCRIEAVASLDNLFLAAEKARRGKSRRPDVEAWWMNRECELVALREELLGGSYQPGAYHFFELFRPKRRMVAAAPFRDRVVHHALCNLMAPLLERRFLARSFSCQLGKGTTAARECCRSNSSRSRSSSSSRKHIY